MKYDPLNQLHRDTRQLVFRLIHQKQTDESIIRRLQSSVGTDLKYSQWIVQAMRNELTGARRKQGATLIWTGLVITSIGSFFLGWMINEFGQPIGFKIPLVLFTAVVLGIGCLIAGSYYCRHPNGFLQGTRAIVKQDLGWFRWRSG